MKSLVGFVSAFLLACGPKPGAEAPKGGDTATVTLPDVPFEQLDQDQRAAFMKQKVVPTMQPLFQNHNPKAFAEFGCKTCHGDEVKDGHFDMPNPKLPKLNFNDMSKFKGQDVDWMKHEILPTMSKLLQLPEHSQQNPKGFGCLNCHTQEGQ